jgi:hypothetical protein
MSAIIKDSKTQAIAWGAFFHCQIVTAKPALYLCNSRALLVNGCKNVTTKPTKAEAAIDASPMPAMLHLRITYGFKSNRALTKLKKAAPL